MMPISCLGVKAMLAFCAFCARIEYSGMPRAFRCCDISLRSCSSTFSRSWFFSKSASRRVMRLFRLIDLPKTVRYRPSTSTTTATKMMM